MDALTEETDPYCLSPQQSDELLHGRNWRRYAVLGDSLAEGLLEERPGFEASCWADRVRTAVARVEPDLTYLNLGYRGLLAQQVHEQQLKPALEFAPDLATVVCGGNDMFSPTFDRAAVEGHIDTMVASLIDAGSTVFVFGLMNITAAVPELANLKPRLMGLNASSRKVAERRGAVFVDLWDHPAADQRDLYSSDLLHMSSRGHAHIAAITIKTLGASPTAA
jgi:lysophospholipase L1-like esterase